MEGLADRLAVASPYQTRQLDRLLLGYDVFRRTYRADPIAFVHDCIRWDKGTGPAPYQEEVLAALLTYRRVAVRGPHGLGKSAMSAWMLLWLALTWDGTTDWKIGATAGAWFQLAHYLWPEVHKWAGRLLWRKIGREPFTADNLMALRLKLTTGEAYAVASDRPELIEGQHASAFAQIFDESKAIQDKTFDAIEGAFAASGISTAFALACSTPGIPRGRFYDIHARKPGYQDWWTRHVTLDEALAAGRLSPEWVEARKAQWGESSAIYRNRVLGEFAAEEESGVIPYALVERANLAWQSWQDAGAQYTRITSFGVDVAGGTVGGDWSAVGVICDRARVLELVKVKAALDPELATMELVGRVVALQRKYDSKAPVYVDTIGVGAGVYSRLRELGVDARPFVASAGTEYLDSSQQCGFANWRSAMWWMLREALMEPGLNICLPPDDDLIADLVTPRYGLTSTAKYQIESKDTVRRRRGRSTDCADAVLMGLFGPILWQEQERRGAREIIYRPERIA